MGNYGQIKGKLIRADERKTPQNPTFKGNLKGNLGAN